MAIGKAKKEQKPSLISCKTLIGNGAPNKQGTAGSHGAPLGEDEIRLAKNEWNEPFYVPEEVLKLWRDAGSRNQQNYQWIGTKGNKVKSLLFKKSEFNERLGLARKKSIKYFWVIQKLQQENLVKLYYPI